MYIGFLKTKTPIDLLEEKEISGFDIQGEGEFYFAFLTGLKWGKIVNGELVDLPTQDISFDSLIKEGNTLEELSSMTDVPCLAENLVNVAIAMGDLKTPPTLKFGIKAARQEIELVKTIESEEYTLHGDIQTIEGDATDNVEITVSAYKNGKWLPYVALDKVTSECEKVKFKATLTLTEAGQKAEFREVTLTALSNDAVIPSNSVSLYTESPVSNANIYVVGNNRGIVKAFCSNTTPTQWKELNRIADYSFGGANGMLKLVLEADGNDIPEIKGYVIREG